MFEAMTRVVNSGGEWFCTWAWAMLWQSSIIIAVLLVLDTFLRKHARATVRYALWMLVLAKLVLPPSLCMPTGLGYWCDMEPSVKTATPEIQDPRPEIRISNIEFINPGSVQNQKVIAAASIAVEGKRGQTPEEKGSDPISQAVTWRGALCLLWIAGMVMLALLMIQRVVFVRGLIAQSEPATGRLAETMEACSRQAGVQGDIELRLTQNMLSPAACGLLRPVVLMPRPLLEGLSRERVRAVLMHELAHIRRKDLWVNLTQTALQIVYFYNPLLWVANSRIRGIREQAVDEMVLTQLGSEACEYGRTLVAVAERAFARAHFSLGLVGVVESKKSLATRIRHIAHMGIPKSAKIGLIGMAAILLIGAVLLPMANAKDRPAEFVIRGRVTDVATGKPIAGARVGDDGYAGGKQWTTTDANGKYSYLTWYEEHNIECSAPGYNTKKDILLTKLLGKEKEKVIDFALVADKSTAAPEFKTVLPSGVEIELVAISHYPDKDQPFWRPDGTPLKEPPFDTSDMDITSSSEPRSQKIELVFRMGGSAAEPGYESLIQRTDGGWTWWAGRRFKNKQIVSEMKVIGINAASDEKTLSLDLRVAAGPWTTQPDEAGAGRLGNVTIAPNFTEPSALVTARVDVKQEDAQVVAIDDDGNRHVSHYAQDRRGKGANAQADFIFSGLAPAKVRSVTLQTRTYETIHLKDISLIPGRPAAARVTSAAPVAPPALPQTALPDLGIREGMMIFEVEARLGQPTAKGSVLVTNYNEPPHMLYIYDKRPEGEFHVQFSPEGCVERAEWLKQDWLRQDDVQQLMMEQRDIQRQMLEKAQQRYSTGTATMTEVQQAQIALLQTQSKLAQSQAQRAELLAQVVEVHHAMEKAAEAKMATGVMSRQELDKVRLELLAAQEELVKARQAAGEAKSAALQAEAGPDKWSRNMPGWGTVRLAAVFKPNEKPWKFWDPDGKPLPDFQTDAYQFRDIKGTEVLAVVFQRPPYPLESPVGHGDFYSIQHWNEGEDVNKPVAAYGHGCGTWEDRGKLELDKALRHEGRDYVLTKFWQQGDDENSVVHVQVDYRFNPGQTIRVVAVDAEGGQAAFEAPGMYIGNFADGQMMSYYQALRGLPKAKIAYLKLQTQPLTWARFDGFATEPRATSPDLPDRSAQPLPADPNELSGRK